MVVGGCFDGIGFAIELIGFLEAEEEGVEEEAIESREGSIAESLGFKLFVVVVLDSSSFKSKSQESVASISRSFEKKRVDSVKSRTKPSGFFFSSEKDSKSSPIGTLKAELLLALPNLIEPPKPVVPIFLPPPEPAPPKGEDFDLLANLAARGSTFLIIVVVVGFVGCC